MKFEIGDRVKCIRVGSVTGQNGLVPPLVLNREYIVYDIKTCSCGSVTLDIGMPHPHPIMICVCNKEYISNVWWCSSKRFVKVQEKKEYIAVSSNVEVEELTPN